MTDGDKNENTKGIPRGDRYAKDRKYLISLIHELEADDGLDRLNLADNLLDAKAGSMIAYLGDLQCKREGVFERGLLSFFKRFITKEVPA